MVLIYCCFWNAAWWVVVAAPSAYMHITTAASPCSASTRMWSNPIH
jgi:hypothetical protein